MLKLFERAPRRKWGGYLLPICWGLFILLGVRTTGGEVHQVQLSNVQLPRDHRGELLLTGEAGVVFNNGTFYLYTNDWGACPAVNCCASKAVSQTISDSMAHELLTKKMALVRHHSPHLWCLRVSIHPSIIIKLCLCHHGVPRAVLPAATWTLHNPTPQAALTSRMVQIRTDITTSFRHTLQLILPPGTIWVRLCRSVLVRQGS